MKKKSKFGIKKQHMFMQGVFKAAIACGALPHEIIQMLINGLAVSLIVHSRNEKINIDHELLSALNLLESKVHNIVAMDEMEKQI